jgi:hypothetical protein
MTNFGRGSRSTGCRWRWLHARGGGRGSDTNTDCQYQFCVEAKTNPYVLEVYKVIHHSNERLSYTKQQTYVVLVVVVVVVVVVGGLVVG